MKMMVKRVISCCCSAPCATCCVIFSLSGVIILLILGILFRIDYHYIGEGVPESEYHTASTQSFIAMGLYIAFVIGCSVRLLWLKATQNKRIVYDEQLYGTF